MNETVDERTPLLLHDSTEEVGNKDTLSPDDYEITEKFEMVLNLTIVAFTCVRIILYTRWYTLLYRVPWPISFIIQVRTLILGIYIIRNSIANYLLVFVVAIVLYYITICLYVTGSLATILVVIVKTLVVVVW